MMWSRLLALHLGLFTCSCLADEASKRASLVAKFKDVDTANLETALKLVQHKDLAQKLELIQQADVAKLKTLASSQTQQTSNIKRRRRMTPAKRRAERRALKNTKRRLHDANATVVTAAPAAEEPDPMAGTDAVMDHIWLMVCGTFVMFMQAGFAMLEAGTCRVQNVQSILLKNLMDVCVGTVAWYVMGWSLAYGGDTQTPESWKDGTFEECDMEENPGGCGDGYADNGFIGGKIHWFGMGFLGSGKDADKDWAEGSINPLKYGGGQAYLWFFQWAFCTAASTIVSGGVAERVRFPPYAVFSFLMSGFIYPAVVCSTWGYGWLETFKKKENGDPVAGYIDFAGSSVVHLTGGVGALVGAIIVGRRTGRFDPNVDQSEFQPHSQPLVVLGTFILWMGWYGFNPGSTLGFSDNATALKAAMVAMNTTLSAATGGLTVFVLRYAMFKKYDLAGLCNGILAGLVSITAPCSNVESGSAFLIGIIGGIVFTGASALLQKLKVDDPLDAFGVHGAAGIWGTIAAAVFDFGSGTDKHHGWSGWSAVTYTEEEGGEVKYMATGEAFAANIVLVLFVLAWVGGMTGVILGTFKVLGVLRIQEATESTGMDDECLSPKAYVTENRGSKVEASSS